MPIFGGMVEYYVWVLWNTCQYLEEKGTSASSGKEYWRRWSPVYLLLVMVMHIYKRVEC